MSELSRVFQQWQQAGWINALDVALPDFLQQHSPQPLPELFRLLTVMLSQQLAQGHVCLDLQRCLQQPDRMLAMPEYYRDEGQILPSQLLQGVTLADCLAALQQALMLNDGEGHTPLVLQGQRLYLRRYWQYETFICQRIRRLMEQQKPLDEAGLKQALTPFFGGDDSTADWQKIACALAMKSHFTVITGGPGTGKTTTVVKLLLLLQQMQTEQQQPLLQIRMAAPTGKAAARLKESVQNACRRLLQQQLISEQQAAHIPQQALTLHKLLGRYGNSRRSRYHQGQPLPLDVLIVDEASMVDIEMMAQLLAALPDHAMCILLGDKDQLSSVEAGAILGELCRNTGFGKGEYTEQTAQWLAGITGHSLAAQWQNPQGSALDQHIVMLQKSHRFTASSGIGQLAQAVNQGDVPRFKQLWQQGFTDIEQLHCQQFNEAALVQKLLGSHQQPAGFAAYLALVRQPPQQHEAAHWDAWANTILQAYSSFQVLCATREGEWGVEQINQKITALLSAKQYVSEAKDWFIGRPVIITRNDYALGLMNGDIGITLQKPVEVNGQTELQKRVAFFNSDGSIKWVLPSRLNHVETVFAMTIHKSQGSEFEQVLMLLPEYDMPMLSRELIYTGITRARKHLSLLAPQPALLPQALQRRVERSGGIKWQMQG